MIIQYESESFTVPLVGEPIDALAMHSKLNSCRTQKNQIKSSEKFNFQSTKLVLSKNLSVDAGHALGIWICGCSLFYRRELWASKSAGAKVMP